MKRRLLFIFFLFLSLKSNTGIESFSERTQTIANGSYLDVYDDKYYEMQTPGWENSLFSVVSAKNFVRIGYLPDD